LPAVDNFHFSSGKSYIYLQLSIIQINEISNERNFFLTRQFITFTEHRISSMSNPIEFRDYDFDDANNLLNESSIKPPTMDCVGYFEGDTGGQFYWFNDEEDLRFWLLNGWYGRSTEERDTGYYDGVQLLKNYLESGVMTDQIWSKMPKTIWSEYEILWSGHVTQLLTEDNIFAEGFREEFRQFLIKEAPSIPHNKIGIDPPDTEILDVLVKFVTGYLRG